MQEPYNGEEWRVVAGQACFLVCYVSSTIVWTGAYWVYNYYVLSLVTAGGELRDVKQYRSSLLRIGSE